MQNEIEKLKQDILKLELSFSHLKEKLHDITISQTENFDKLFSKIDNISKGLESLNHYNLRLTMLENTLNTIDKCVEKLKNDVAVLEKRIDNVAITNATEEKNIKQNI